MYDCPMSDYTCPYFDRRTFQCTLENPEDDCDDYRSYYEAWEEAQDALYDLGNLTIDK